MKKTVEAIIDWISPEEGRATKLPLGIKYGPLIELSQNTYSSDFWSSEIYILAYITDMRALIKLSYLSPHAPYHLLLSCKTFKLFEGRKLVATGEII